MLGSLMQHNDIDGVIVGADRIVKNGDTANKVSLVSQDPSSMFDPSSPKRNSSKQERGGKHKGAASA